MSQVHTGEKRSERSANRNIKVLKYWSPSRRERMKLADENSEVLSFVFSITPILHHSRTPENG